MESNPAWNSLRAVKKNKVLILPSEIEDAPDLYIDKLFEKIAKFVYPNAYEG
jgi:iron complex transport system substrate-binding protein